MLEHESLQMTIGTLREDAVSIDVEIARLNAVKKSISEKIAELSADAERLKRLHELKVKREQARNDPEWLAWAERFNAKCRAESHSKSQPNFISGLNWFFVRSDCTDRDKELLFGPLDGTEQWTIIESEWTLAHLLAAVRLFPSVSQARKNGGEGPVPAGWTHMSRGKNQNRREIFIWNPTE